MSDEKPGGSREVGLNENKKRRIERPITIDYAPVLKAELKFEPDMFRQHFGITITEFHGLHKWLGNLLRFPEEQHYKVLTGPERLALCLRYLSSGDTVHELSKRYGLRSNWISTFVAEASSAIVTKLTQYVMPLPTVSTWLNNAEQFQKRFNIPNCIGVLTCAAYTISGMKIVILALVDPNDRIMLLDLAPYPLTHDRGAILDQSRLGNKFQHKMLHLPAHTPLPGGKERLPFFIYSDDCFSSKSYAVSEYTKTECEANPTNAIYNVRISRGLKVGKRSVARMFSKWKLFRKPQAVPDPLSAEKIATACACLYNFFDLGMHPIRWLDYPESSGTITEEKRKTLINCLPKDSTDIRDKLKAYFLSANGEVPWQWPDAVSSTN